MRVHDGWTADAVADWLAGRLGRRLRSSPGEVAITVPGGATPFPILEALVSKPLPFPRLTVWPNDERVVPDGHAASNGARLRALFAPVGAAVATLEPGASPPRFALTWIGMGADGHIASLFPSSEPDPRDSEAIRRITPEPLPPEAPFARITLTLPALLNCEEVLLVISGAGKRRVLEDALAGRSDLPIARFLRHRRQPMTCFA
ncbi:6-phosphogluconolactonase [Erythrobacteraceae bacterium CFH 75059]|nr:6-phosphogluconolactonase [Erythrobacteraceae bacterium CFH 75059]